MWAASFLVSNPSKEAITVNCLAKSFYIFLLDTNFENLTIIVLHVLYVINTYIKFHSMILFTIRSINLFFIHNFLLQKLEI